MFALVSTICGHHFVRLFPSHDKALEFAHWWIATNFPESAFDDNDDGLQEFAETLGPSEWFFIELVTESEPE